MVEVSTADDDWLDVKLGSSGSKTIARLAVPLASGSAEIPLTIALRPESDLTRAALPPGVLVRARWGGRTYHRRIPLRIEPGSEAPPPDLRRQPDRADASRLGRSHPGHSRQGVVFDLRAKPRRPRPPVRHRAESPSRAGRRGFGDLDRQAWRDDARVSFGPPPANPGAGVVEVLGPLTIRLVDLDDPTFRINRTIPVGLASPADYVRVVSALYTPPGSAGGEKPRLEFRLRAVGPIEGAPCPVELSLPLDRIPGLISPGDGTFKAKLEKPGDEVTLFAEDFELDPRGDEWGHVHLAVDGVERALVYRVRFARRGTPTVPSLDLQPAVRLKAERVALSTAPLKVNVEIDSPPESGKLKLALGQFTATGTDDRFRVRLGDDRGPVEGPHQAQPSGARRLAGVRGDRPRFVDHLRCGQGPGSSVAPGLARGRAGGREGEGRAPLGARRPCAFGRQVRLAAEIWPARRGGQLEGDREGARLGDQGGRLLRGSAG